ncbi:MAG: hypothetical protein AAGG57_12640 [Pseudomonadota bacterium]
MLNATNGISGTEAEDTLNGTDDGDFIRGLAGADTITAGLGNDVIFGGEGVDRVDGGAGNDLLWDPNGEDVLLGGSGDDIMIGGSTAFAGDGDDLIISTSTAGGPVDVFGGSGADTMIGSDQGVEIYRYNLFAPDSTPDTPDTILNFQRGQDSFQFGELIARVDFLGDAAFSGNANPDLVIEARFADGRLEFDEDSDAVADKVIILEGVDTLTAEDLGVSAPEPAEETTVQVFGGIGTDTFVGDDNTREVYRYNLFADDSPADAPDVIQNLQPGQDSLFFGELGTRIDFLGDAAFSGDPDPNLGIEARFADSRLEIDEDADAVADKVIILEGIQSVTEAELFGFA